MFIYHTKTSNNASVTTQLVTQQSTDPHGDKLGLHTVACKAHHQATGMAGKFHTESTEGTRSRDSAAVL